MINLDAVAHTSKVKDLYPKTRISLIFISLILSILVNSEVLYLAFLALSVLWMYGTTFLSIKQIFKLLSIPMLFVLTSCFLILISFSSIDGVILWQGPVHLTIYKANAIMAQETLLRSLCGISMIFCISTTVPMRHFMNWMRMLRLPEEFIELFVLTYRFLFILLEEASDLVTAGDMRFGYSSLKTAFPTMGMMIKSLLFKTFKRYEDLSQSLELRQSL